MYFNRPPYEPEKAWAALAQQWRRQREETELIQQQHLAHVHATHVMLATAHSFNNVPLNTMPRPPFTVQPTKRKLPAWIREGLESIGESKSSNRKRAAESNSNERLTFKPPLSKPPIFVRKECLTNEDEIPLIPLKSPRTQKLTCRLLTDLMLSVTDHTIRILLNECAQDAERKNAQPINTKKDEHRRRIFK